MTTLFPVVLIIGIGISVTLFAVLLDNAYSQKRTARLLSAFNDAATEFNLSLSKFESIGARAIGLDDDKSKLFFLGHTKKKYDGYLVDLAEIEKFTIKKVYATRGAPYSRRLGAVASIDSVSLELSYKNGAIPLSLPFYDKDKDPIYEVWNRLAQAKEWQSLLATRLNKNEGSVDGEENILQKHHQWPVPEQEN